MTWTIAFDGDDTLWHNETVFDMTQERFRQLLARYVDGADVDQRLLETERGNLRLFGYGIKGFVLSMVETAVEVTEGRVSAHDIQTILDFGKAMLQHPVELLEGARETVERLAAEHSVMLITKGDLFDQESKIARSGLAELFDRIEILSEKDEASYRRVLERHGVAPGRFVMVGNSVRSDVLPVLGVGGHAVHVPYRITWAHEAVPGADAAADGFLGVDRLAELPDLLERLFASAAAAG